VYQGEKSQSIITDRMSNKEDLPSINDYLEDSNLPSYKDFKEEKQQLPSVKDYISKSSKEEILVEETVKDIDHVLSETAPEWAELVRLVNDLRKEIPEIPEIKYYDEELSNLSSKLTHIEEYFTQFDQKSNKIDDLDVKNEHLEEKLTEIESKIPEIPTIRYYDHDIEHINDKITQLREDVSSLPEIKHYDSDIASLVEEINKVKSRDVPDFRWIGNTFNTIDEDFTRVQGHLDVIKEKISFEVSELNENIQVNNFEQNVNVKNLKDNISEKIDQTNNQLTETKDKIYSELSKSSLKNLGIS
jgi:predicted RNase H-like nuclease (RuvC/YqgF family)